MFIEMAHLIWYQRQCKERYQSKNLRIMMYNLKNAVKEGIRGCRHAVSQEGRIPSLEEHTKSTPEVSSSLSLWLPSIPGQCSSKLLHLSFSCLVPAPQGLGGKREEADPLLLAILCCCGHFTLIGEGESVTGSFSSSSHRSILEGVYHSYVKSSVSPPCPVG